MGWWQQAEETMSTSVDVHNARTADGKLWVTFTPKGPWLTLAKSRRPRGSELDR